MSGGPSAGDGARSPRPSFTGLHVWSAAGAVVCALCDTVKVSSTALASHLKSAPHKTAVAAATDSRSGAVVPPPSSAPFALSLATATEEECKAAVAAVRTPGQVATLGRYGVESGWPSAPDDAHPAPVPCLSIRSGMVACYDCQSACRSSADLAKLHVVVAGSVPKCSNRTWVTVCVQTLQQGNKTCFFPVAFLRDPLPYAPARPPPGAPAPSSATLPLHVFLGKGGGGSSAAAGGSVAAVGATDTANAQCGALLRIFKFPAVLAKLGWSPEAVVEHFSIFPLGDGSIPASDVQARAVNPQWLLFLSLKKAVLTLFKSSLEKLRDCDLTISLQLAVGGLAGLGSADGKGGEQPRRPTRLNIVDKSVAVYATDVALVLYVVVRLAELGRRSASEELADGRSVPELLPVNARFAARVQTEFHAALSVVERDQGVPGASSVPAGDDPSDHTAAAVAEHRSFASPVSALLRGLAHEEYDPRSVATGGSGKGRPDLSLVMPFVALLYPRSSTMSPRRHGPPGLSFMDADAAQHLASALLFSIRAVNALVFFNTGRPLPPTTSKRGRRDALAAVFQDIADATNPSGTTAAAYVVMFRSTTEAMARSEKVPPTFLLCKEPAHLAGAPSTAVCGTLLENGVHLGTPLLGEFVSTAQARLWGLFQKLVFAYDPTGSGFFTTATHLVDRPAVHATGVSFLDLRANRALVTGWQQHFVSSGALDDPKCPVRPAYKPRRAGGGGSAAGDQSSGGGDGSGGLPEVDPTRPPLTSDAPGLASWAEMHVEFRFLLAALMLVVGGAPPRITEHICTVISASTSGARRNVFVLHGEVYTIMTYSKTSHQTVGGGRPIMRWMDAKTSTLILLAMVFLDPLEAYFARAVAPDGSSLETGCATLLTAPDGRLFRAPGGDEAACRRFSKVLGTLFFDNRWASPITASVFRHFAAALAKHVSKVNILEADFGVVGGGGGISGASSGAATAAVQTADGDVADWGRVMELQSGHSPATASSAYAGDASDSIYCLNNAMVYLYHRASLMYHAAMLIYSSHLPSGLRHPLEQLRVGQQPTAALASVSGVGGGCGAGTGRSGTLSASLERLAPAGLVSVGGGSVSARLSRSYRLTRDEVRAAADAKTRELFGAGMYRNAEQQEGVYTILQTRGPVTVLFVMPTASGKTATLLIPAAVEAEAAVAAAREEAIARGAGFSGLQELAGGYAAPAPVQAGPPAPWYPPVTIVLTPTRAVTANMVSAAKAAGIAVGDWPRGCDAGDASLFVIDMARVVHDFVIFSDVVRRLAAAGRLARVAIDEAHLVLLWGSSFREALLQLRTVLADLVCPLLLFTATAPVAGVEPMLAGVGVSSRRPVAVVRASTTRQALTRYMVESIGPAFRRHPERYEDGNGPLHKAISQRVIAQVRKIGNGSGDRQGRSAVIAVFCETVAEVDGIAAHLHETVRRSEAGGDLDDVVVRKYHSQGAAADGSMGSGGQVGGEHQTHGTAGGGRRPLVNVAHAISNALSQPGVGVVIVVASPAVSTGTDIKNLRWALFLGPRHLLALLQGAGRLAREGDGSSTALVIHPHGYNTSDLDQAKSIVPDVAALGDARKWAQLPPNECRRWMFDSLFDGVARKDFQSCLDGGFARCDFCTLKASNAARDASTRKRPRPDDDDIEEDDDGQRKRRTTPLPASTMGRLPGLTPRITPLGRPFGGQTSGGRRSTTGDAGPATTRHATGPQRDSVGGPSVGEAADAGGEDYLFSLVGSLPDDPLLGLSLLDAAGGDDVESSDLLHPLGQPSSSSTGARARAGRSHGGEEGQISLSPVTPRRQLSGSTASAVAARQVVAPIRFAAGIASGNRDAAYGRIIEKAVDLGRRAAAAIWDSSPVTGATTPPCAKCRTYRAAQDADDVTRHGPTGCLAGICMHCLKQSRGGGVDHSGSSGGSMISGDRAECFDADTSAGCAASGDGQFHSDVCTLLRSQCATRPPPWMPSREPVGRKCYGCRMGLALRAGQFGVVSIHKDRQMGPWGCRWLHVIRVVLLQALAARQLMTETNGDFGAALRSACGGVDWTQLADCADGSGAGGRDGAGYGPLGGGGMAAMPGRVPPARLLNWGRNRRIGTDITELGRWLTDGETLPNVVLFAPTVATSLGLQY